MKEAIHLAAKALVKSTGIDNPYPFQIENAEGKVQLIIDVLAENGYIIENENKISDLDKEIQRLEKQLKAMEKK